MKPRTWRVTDRKGPKGAYFSLRTGSRDARVSLGLGYISREEAQCACEQMNREEVAGRASRVIAWHGENKEQVVRYLVGDAGVATLVAPPEIPRTLVLSDYFDRHYAEWRRESAPGSWRTEERMWARILEELGSTRLRDIDAHLVADYLDGLIARSGPRKGQAASGNMKRLHRAALQALLKRAYRLRHIPELPQLAVFQIRGATKTVIEKPDPLSLAELGALLQVSEPKYRAMWAVAAGQGLRPMELSSLRWEDVDLAERVLRIRGTKTEGSDALVPMTPVTHRELERWWTRESCPCEGLLFVNKHGEAYGRQGWKKPLVRCARKAGITRRIYPYLLRDSFATIAWSLGIPLDLARRVMRHTGDSRMLEQVYCRPRPSDLAEQLRAFQLGDGG